MRTRTSSTRADPPLANIFLDVTAEATPITGPKGIPWAVHLIAPASRDSGANQSLLMHSTVYENPRVLGVVCDWITGPRAKTSTAVDAPHVALR